MKTLCCRDYRTAGWCSHCEVGDPANCTDRMVMIPAHQIETKQRRDTGRDTMIAILLIAGLTFYDVIRFITDLAATPPNTGGAIYHLAMTVINGLLLTGLIFSARRHRRTA